MILCSWLDLYVIFTGVSPHAYTLPPDSPHYKKARDQARLFPASFDHRRVSTSVGTRYIKIGFSVFFLLVSSDCVLALAAEGGMPPPVISLPANANQDKLSEPEQSPLQRKESGENPLMVGTLKPN